MQSLGCIMFNIGRKPQPSTHKLLSAAPGMS